jgi:hypothetical protein
VVEPKPTVSAVDLKAKGQFPKTYVHALKAKGEFPGWANYACFDPDPRLESSYFLLVAYSLKPVAPSAAKLGVEKGVTYQEYIGEMPLNRPPTIEELQQQMANKKAGEGISVELFNMLNASLQARDNLKYTAVANKDTLKDDFETTLVLTRDPPLFWAIQKYTNAAPAGWVFPTASMRHSFKRCSPTIEECQFKDDWLEQDVNHAGLKLGFVLYELAPGTNVFHTHDPDGQATIAEDLIMQPTSDGLFFTFSSYVSGVRTLPLHCKFVLFTQGGL